jgi:NAD(P)H-dependent FMN reductase
MLLRAAVEAAPPGTSIDPESIREIPLYDGDIEDEQGVPPSVQRLKDRIAEADGLLVVTPEYNNSIPGVLKNAIDWLSRPAADIPRVFRGRPVAIIGANHRCGENRAIAGGMAPRPAVPRHASLVRRRSGDS